MGDWRWNWLAVGDERMLVDSAVGDEMTAD
jgi:hypothetical protein